ncbi:O-antigen ligase [Kocuria sp. WN036]|uniref:O-antigen ligase family protein n=1 Tax=Kocuria sp. WN036 TaxID=2032628 RepID=UPI001140B633|nr:hypothetical protein [Kocuria sp. WN036]
MDPFIAAIALACFFCASLAIILYPQVGLLLLATTVAIDWHFPASPNFFSLAGIQIKLSDVVVVLLTPGLAWGLFSKKGRLRFTASVGGVLALMGVLLMSLVSGIRFYGLGTAVNEARSWIYIIIVALWCGYAQRGRKWRTSVENFVVWTGVAVSFIWGLNTLQYGFGGASGYVGARELFGQQIEVGRATSSGQTIFLAASAVIALHKFRDSQSLRHLALSGIFISIVLLAQHRSVWIAAGIMLFVYTVRTYRHKIGVILFAAIGATLAYTLLRAGFAETVGENLTGSATDTRTFEGRVYDWVYSLRELAANGFYRIFFGWDFGRGYERIREDGLLIEYIPHSWYVGTLLRSGVVGLLGGLIWVASILRNEYFNRQAAIALPILVGLLAYSVSYNLQWYLAPLLVLTSIYNLDSDSKANAVSARQRAEGDFQHDRAHA